MNEMPFILQQDVLIVEAYFRNGTMNEDGTWSYSAHSCFEQFINAFPDEAVYHEYESFAHHQRDVVRRFCPSGSVCKGKSTGRPTVLTDTAIQARMEHSPNNRVII